MLHERIKKFINNLNNGKQADPYYRVLSGLAALSVHVSVLIILLILLKLLILFVNLFLN